MSIALTVLALGCVLGVVQIFVAAQLTTRLYGKIWAYSSREAPMPPPSPFVGRMMRAQANFLETFPIAVAAILMVEVAGLNSGWTAVGAISLLAGLCDRHSRVANGVVRHEHRRHRHGAMVGAGMNRQKTRAVADGP